MKKGLLLSVLMFLLGAQFAVNAQDLAVSDIQFSRLDDTQSSGNEITRTIILTREGTNLNVQLLNYESYSTTLDFSIKTRVNGGKNDSPYSLSVSLSSFRLKYIPTDNPYSLYNISFTINGLETNSFLISCWWYEGMVTLTDGESLELLDIIEDVSINEIVYTLHKISHTAELTNGTTWEGELTIPSEVSYEEQDYAVTSIGGGAFDKNNALTSVVIPSSITSIESSAFYHCTGLTSINILEGVKSIGSYAFKECTNLATINIPNSVTHIGSNAFDWTAWYNNQPDGLIYINTIAYKYKGTMPEGTDLYIKKGTSAIAPAAFLSCSGLTFVTIPESVTSIGDRAFQECSNLVSVGIPNSVTYIGVNAFAGCSSLASITIPKSVNRIENGAFEGCSGLTSVTIPDGVTSIEEYAFNWCSGLVSVTIPKTVTSIGFAFYGCNSLSDVYCYAENVPRTTTNSFNETPIESATLHVPAVSVDKYKATEPWSSFGNIVTTASDIQHSGCMSRTRASSKSTTQSISLLKEGNILTVNLRNFWSTCDTQDFEVTPSVSDGNNSDPYTVSVRVKPIGEDIADCICPYNISFTIHDVEANSFQFKCWWFNGQVNLTEGEPWVMSNEYYPEGTKWTEIRLDTLKYDSWYSKVDDEWVPNFETVEYSVKGEYTPKYWEVPFKCVYTNSQECTDSLALLIYEGRDYGYDMGVLATVPLLFDDNTTPYPGEAYFFDWGVGMTLRFVDILSNNTTAIYPPGTFDFGIIEEIKEGNFGGVRPLKYTDVNGVRIIQGIGVTTWNDGECIFGPVKPYRALSFFKEDFPRNERNYRSMLVHFERNGEVLYNVWPGTLDDMVTFTEGQMATIILPTAPDASKGKYYRLDRCEDEKIIFEEEKQPKARTPYIIVPKEDFSIDLNMLNLAGLSQDTVSIKGISFIGSYIQAEFDYNEDFYIDIIDITDDCRQEESAMGKTIIGPLRAFLQVSWDDPYHQGGTKGRGEKLEIVLHDDGTGLTPNPSPVRDENIYDLSGRKINSPSSILNAEGVASGKREGSGNSQLPKGIYILNGKKVVVK